MVLGENNSQRVILIAITLSLAGCSGHFIEIIGSGVLVIGSILVLIGQINK